MDYKGGGRLRDMTERDALRAARDELARTPRRLWRPTRPQLPSLTRTTSLWPQSSQMSVSACYAQKSISGWKQHSRHLADAVEKVENRTTPKISQMVIFGLLRRCDAL
jgi:hypothetical protein